MSASHISAITKAPTALVKIIKSLCLKSKAEEQFLNKLDTEIAQFITVHREDRIKDALAFINVTESSICLSVHDPRSIQFVIDRRNSFLKRYYADISFNGKASRDVIIHHIEHLAGDVIVKKLDHKTYDCYSIS